MGDSNMSSESHRADLRSANLSSKRKSVEDSKFMTERGRRDLMDYEAVTDRVKEGNYNRRSEYSERESNVSSQLVFKPKSRIVAANSQKPSPQRFASQVNESRGEDPYKKRIDYLKKLVEKNP